MGEDLSYPIGKFAFPDAVTDADVEAMIQQIAETPGRLRTAVAGLDDAKLDTPYRPGGWSVRQVVHHLADSHLNSYIRFKLAVTENEPVIKAYDEATWARLDDAAHGPVDVSLCLLDALHARWLGFLRSLSPEQLSRTFVHPDMGKVSLRQNIALYAWHGRHHVAHITSLRKRQGWH